jgi:hypothetical protein
MRATGEAKLRCLSRPSVEAPVENDLMYDPPHRRSRIYVECTNLERTNAKPSDHERMDGFFS